MNTIVSTDKGLLSQIKKFLNKNMIVFGRPALPDDFRLPLVSTDRNTYLAQHHLLLLSTGCPADDVKNSSQIGRTIYREDGSFVANTKRSRMARCAQLRPLGRYEGIKGTVFSFSFQFLFRYRAPQIGIQHPTPPLLVRTARLSVIVTQMLGTGGV